MRDKKKWNKDIFLSLIKITKSLWKLHQANPVFMYNITFFHYENNWNIKKKKKKHKLLKIHPLYKGDLCWNIILETIDCRKTLIGLGKYQPFPLLVTGAGENGSSPASETATDLDFLITEAAFVFASPLFPLNSLHSELPRPGWRSDPVSEIGSGLLLADQRNGTATDFDLRNAGSHSIRLATRPTDPTPEKGTSPSQAETEARGVHEQGRSWAQSGQRVERRSWRQKGQTPPSPPTKRRFERSCLEHFCQTLPPFPWKRKSIWGFLSRFPSLSRLWKNCSFGLEERERGGGYKVDIYLIIIKPLLCPTMLNLSLNLSP